MRTSRDGWAMELAVVTARRSTCLRRRVGCVLLSARGHVLATGYNGVPAGFPHCNEGHPCEGAGLPSGEGLDRCWAVHAEQNALLQCRDVHAIDSAYVTVSPCVTCVKLLLNTGCRRIVFADVYAAQPGAESIWASAGRAWELLEFEKNGERHVEERRAQV